MMFGSEFHLEALRGIPKLEDLGPERFLYEIYETGYIKVQEVGPICSHSFDGLRGRLDLLKILKRGEDEFDVTVTDLKTGLHNPSGAILQMVCYGAIVSAPDCAIGYRVPYRHRRGYRIQEFQLWKPNVKLNVNLTLQVGLGAQTRYKTYRYCTGNVTTPWASARLLQISRLLKRRRRFHVAKAYFLANWQEIEGIRVKMRQSRFGKRKLLVQTPPLIRRAIRLD